MKTGIIFISLLFYTAYLNAQGPDILYYDFDSVNGNKVVNMASAPPVGTDTAIIVGSLTIDTTGQCGNAIVGSGNTSDVDYLNTGYTPNISGSWTISMRTRGFGDASVIYYIFGDNNSSSFRCFTNGVAGANNFIIRGPINDVLAPGGAAFGTHVTTFVYDSAAGNIYAYVDDSLVNTVTQTPFAITGAGPFKVMGYSSSNGAPLGGMMDEFRFYNRALSAAEVLLFSLYDSVTISSCDNYVSPSGNYTYTTSGVYKDTIPAVFSCGDSIITINLTIIPSVAVSANTTADTVCAGQQVTLSGSGVVSYVWTGGVTDSVAFTPSSTNNYWVTGTDSNGCSTVDSVKITVLQPVASYTESNATVCHNIADFALTAGTPAGGSYSGNGVVNGNMFSPATGSGNYSIVYTYTDSFGCSASDSSVITVNNCTGIEESVAGNEISIYPNPGNGQYAIQSKYGATYALFSITGNRVMQGEFQKGTNTIDILHEPAGVYFLSLTSGSGSKQTFKIIKN